jgi:hypothetical protein
VARLLVVSRSMALALRMADAHDVVEESMDALPDLVPDPGIDVIVLDVGEPSIAIQTLDRLRSNGRATPLLVVSGYQPAWAGLVAVDIPGVVVVPLPITRSALLDGIELLISRSTAQPDRHDPASPDPAPSDGGAVEAATPGLRPADPALLDTAPFESPRPAARHDAAQPSAPREPVRTDPERAFDAVLLGAVEKEKEAFPAPATKRTDVDAERADAADTGSDTDSEDGEASEPPNLIRPFMQPVVVEHGGWSEPGFEWWTHDADRARPSGTLPEVAGRPVEPATAPAAEPVTRPLRRGWPPSSQDAAQPEVTPPDDVHPEAADDDGELDLAGETLTLGTGSGISPALRSAIESAIQSQRSPGTRTATPALDPEPHPQPETPPASQPSGSDELMAHRRALLGRSSDVAGISAFRRRLGGRAYETSLGPGGTSAELIALGLHLDDPKAPGHSPLETSVETPGEQPAEQPGEVHDAGAVDEWTQAPEQPPSLRRIAAETARAAAPSPAERQIAQHLVLRLIDRVSDMYGVAETAQLLAEDLLDRAGADASAVLVPDGAVWRVSGGIGLRVLERRLVLDATHWLIEQVARGGRTRPVQETDSPDAGQRMAGAPLASWRHLIAVPVPMVEAVVLLARGPESEPFSDDLLRTLDDRVDEAGELLQGAVQIRRLARLMDPLREVDPPGL